MAEGKGMFGAMEVDEKRCWLSFYFVCAFLCFEKSVFQGVYKKTKKK